MFVLTYLLCAIVLAITIGRTGTVCKEYFAHYRKKHYLAHQQKQIAK